MHLCNTKWPVKDLYNKQIILITVAYKTNEKKWIA